jgi:hypothetical protein
MPPPWPRHVKEDIAMMTFHLFHIKTKVSNQVPLNSPFLGATFVYNMLLRRRRKSLTQIKNCHPTLCFLIYLTGNLNQKPIILTFGQFEHVQLDWWSF